MSYQVIARKYRPQSFDQMVGQNHITQTLLNALKNDRLPHALLFTGLRGTGKTSAARILAKTLRCQSLPQSSPLQAAAVTAPCNQCQSCIEITAGRSIDVIEIDGASNNGVDAIRDLRDNVMFMPSFGRYKIYIIDEVHMLSTSAFNALLKTLEEPPAHIVFILATTEVHKIPQTILSRCQRFDFRRIPLKKIADYLQSICEQENIQAETAALWLIARQGDGSMRDSQSLLDQVISFTDGKLTQSNVSQVLGLTERTLIFEVMDCLLARAAAKLVACLEKLNQSGQDPSLFLNELARVIRHSIILKVDSNATEMIDLPADEVTILLPKLGEVTLQDLHQIFEWIIKALTDMNRAEDPQLIFEIALLRMSQSPVVSGSRLGSGEASPAATSPVTKELNTETWLQFIHHVRSSDGLFAAKIENLVFVSGADKKISLQVPQNLIFLADQLQNYEMRQKFQGLIDSHFGQGYTFEVLKNRVEAIGEFRAETARELAEKKQTLASEKQAEELKTQWEADPRVQKAKEVFKGKIKAL